MDKLRSKTDMVPKSCSTLRAQWRSVGWPALASALLLWAAQPPLGLSLLAWIAPIGLLWVVDRREAPNKRGYFCLWLTGCVFWLAILQGIRLAYWPLIFGWLALGLYLAVYFPLFVFVSRHLVHRCRWPLFAAAPVVWSGFELWRSYMLTGYAASTLAHSQFRQPLVIQLADQVGGYGVGLVMMCVAVVAYRLMVIALGHRLEAYDTGYDAGRDVKQGGLWMEACVTLGLLVLMLGYGAWRLNESQRLAVDAKPLLRVALIQENTPSMFDADPQRLMEAWDRYAEQTVKALEHAGHAKGQAVDIIAWPESTFTGYSTQFHCGITWMEDKIVDHVPAEMADRQWDRLSISDMVGSLQREFRSKVAVLHTAIAASTSQSTSQPTSQPTTSSQSTVSVPPPYLLVGNDTVDFTDERVGKYNAVLLIDPQGQVIDRYEKIHLVMFGEYVPLGFVLKPIADAFGLVCTPGESPNAFEVKGVKLAPSICFESMLPQVMSWLLRSLKAQGDDPQILINVTNDSWFRGSSILDHHLACEVLSAVELRRPFLIAANTGLTAWIDGSGRIVQQTKRMEPGFIIAEPLADSRFGLTQVWGDLPGWSMAIIVAVALAHSIVRRKPKETISDKR